MSAINDNDSYISSPFGEVPKPTPPKKTAPPKATKTASPKTSATAKAAPVAAKTSAPKPVAPKPTIPVAPKKTATSASKATLAKPSEVKVPTAKATSAKEDTATSPSGKTAIPTKLTPRTREEKRKHEWKQKDLQGDKAQLIVQKKLSKALLEELIYSFNHYALENREVIDDLRKPFFKKELDKAKAKNKGKAKYVPSDVLMEKFMKSKGYSKVKKNDEAMKSCFANKEFLLETYAKPTEYVYFNTDAPKGRKQQFFKVYVFPYDKYLLPVEKLELPLNLKQIDVVRNHLNGGREVTPLEECEQIMGFIKANAKDIKIVKDK